ncbi:MAG: Ribonucleotide reductase of class II (Coenzyme B12-dependent) [Candidatus Jorgensenbacteria bacterium GW2011_GWA2_45_13]|uniref:Vitamin B12-dependent ribonucleotide reductase n=1 Tax=Candidatus Jorgensenbacteria bacterium GW2011_GWA2_45_13 TaxID=1618662 RepID=A0A0G1L565_9BACT|nr:MAG: Ribonucleotide reductase of class II (Coenzyme B12-dependent) [Candidatus Jorgensenbacteria bacterium GW2011_GWA2_45_13]
MSTKNTEKLVRSKSRGPKKASTRAGIPLKRHFTKEGVHPFDEVKWVRRDAVVGSGEKKVFEQKNVEFPDFWSANAVNITVAKYFRGKLGTPMREESAKQMISRVTKVIREWGEKSGYFTDEHQASVFEDELNYLIVHQIGSFNSPVWFNVGTKEHPQCSACFILSVEDNMDSILDWIKTEGKIFKGGSGAGINLSPLRSKLETLSQGGRSSGPVSFMRGADSVAGMIKSGGTTRRAAKMVVLNIDHPDVVDFIESKANEEDKIHALMEAGYNMADLNNEAWNSIQFQNANNSVRITDDFMEAVERDGEWQTKFLTTGEPAETYRAKNILEKIATAAWKSGDPGVQFDTVINKWHTCPNSGRINASNPCSEYMHLDNSACNLASINLMRFLKKNGSFDAEAFKQAVDVFILAQEIIVGPSSYPTEKIGENARKFRELGLGFANLGALLMAKGLPYDSEEGRALAGAVSSLLAGEAYRYSAVIAKRMGPFEGYAENRDPMLQVMKMHAVASYNINTFFLDDDKLIKESKEVWQDAYTLGSKYGFRNSQVTVIAPTGTISFMMDCDTTGIEPDFSLVKMKQLVGGGWMKIVNAGVGRALTNLGYTDAERDEIVASIEERSTIEGVPYLKDEHLPVFDCAVRQGEGTRSISWKGHVRMVAAVQPFISGAISKTFNMENETTAEEIAEAYMMAWKMGIKAFAVYRDGSKATQPLNTSAQKKKEEPKVGMTDGMRRRRPARTRPSETHKFSIAGHEGYLTYSMYEDGSLSEIFIRMAKQGSTLSGLLDVFAISVSMAIQYGVPVNELARKFIYTRFEPAGFTENENIKIATSIVDYIFRYLALRFLSSDDLAEFGMTELLEEAKESAPPRLTAKKEISEVNVPLAVHADHHETESHGQTVSAPVSNKTKSSISAGTVCRKCGGIMVRTGTCMTCLQCGESSGGCS